jgi:hypothetical protein
MKYLKKFNESFDRDELDKQIAAMNASTQADVEYAKEHLVEFVNVITKLITTNYQLDYLDDNKIKSIIDEHFGDITYTEIFNTPKSSTQQLVAYIINVGYSIGYHKPLNPNSDFRVDFQELMSDMMKMANFDKIDDKKLNYKGPEIKSGSVLATCIDIQQSINDRNIYKKFIEDHEDEEYPELLLLVIQVYRYGYGLGSDEGELQKWANNKRYDDLNKELRKAIQAGNEPEMLRIMDEQDKLRK